MINGDKTSRTGQERVYGGIDAEERVADRRQKLIDAGVRLFSLHGYHGTTVRALINESGLATRYFYESFESSEQLLIACYQHLTGKYRKDLELILEQEYGSTEELVRAGVRCYFEAMQDPSFMRITQIEILGVSEAVDAMYFAALEQFGDVLINKVLSINSDSAQLRIPAEDIPILGSTITGAVSIATSLWAREGYSRSIDRMIDLALVVIMGSASYLKGSASEPN